MTHRILAAVLIVVGTASVAHAARAQSARENVCARDIQRICPQEEIDAGERAIKQCIHRDWRWFSERCRYELWVQAVPALAVPKLDARADSE